MDVKITPSKLKGKIEAVSSKSDAHRVLIASALCDTPADVYLNNISEDIEATLRCIKAFGGEYELYDGFVRIFPFKEVKKAEVFCGESGTTARFILPMGASICREFTMTGAGRLPQRPFTELVREMKKQGCEISSDRLPISVKGKLDTENEFFMEGNVSSQYISGLLFAIAGAGMGGKVTLTSPLESAGYVDMTVSTLKNFGADIEFDGKSYVVSQGRLKSPGKIYVEGDWSNGAFFAVAKFLGSDIEISGLKDSSLQRDKAVKELLPLPDEIDAKDIPDIVPILCVAAAGMEKTTRFYNTKRLKIKESDRVKSTCDLINNLGGHAESDENSITIFGKGYLEGGVISSFNDHRIAMSGAIASTICKGEVVIKDAYCVKKSYPDFYKDFSDLGGQVNDI